MSEITDLLAEWVNKEAPRDGDGNLIADRFDFFQAGYRLGEKGLADRVAELEQQVERYRAALMQMDGECEHGDCSCRYFHAVARTALKEEKDGLDLRNG